ncbi:hypothetical protein D4R42_00175 [bacterium]|nr:MAG: hypothetical protein D4R42_00175 [bacterium]
MTIKKLKEKQLETPRQYALRLLNIAEKNAKIKSEKENKRFLDNWLPKDSVLRQLFDEETNV